MDNTKEKECQDKECLTRNWCSGNGIDYFLCQREKEIDEQSHE